MIGRVVSRGLAGLVFLAGVLCYFTVHFQPPKLPDTSLGPTAKDTYRYSLKKMVAAREEAAVGVSLSVRETSYLLELLLPTSRAYGFEIVDVHMEGRGEHARLRLVLRGPMDLYYRMGWTGRLRLRDGRWRVLVSELSVGRVPLGWCLPSQFSPRWPRTWFHGEIHLQQAELDGRGLRARVRRFDVPVRLLLQRTPIPGVESAGVFQPRRDAVDREVKPLQETLLGPLVRAAKPS